MHAPADMHEYLIEGLHLGIQVRTQMSEVHTHICHSLQKNIIPVCSEFTCQKLRQT